MVPSSAAKAAPERPQTMMAVISGPSSRVIERPTRSATKMLAPNCLSWTADWKPITKPIRKLMSTTMGTASEPVRFMMCATSRQLAVRGRRRTPPMDRTMLPTKARTSCTSSRAS